MWWFKPVLREFNPLLSPNLLDIVARAYALIEVGGLTGCGAQRGRNFEQLFYKLCRSRSIHLCEKAGARTVAGNRSASRLPHEVDGIIHSSACVTQWELKHLSTEVPKNELLIFNGKCLDFLQGSQPYLAQTPVLRFLLTGSNLRDECRYFAILWSIMVIEPFRLPVPLLYEAVARGAAECLSSADCDVVRDRICWACRSLQSVIKELFHWTTVPEGPVKCGPGVIRIAREILDVQEQIGATVVDYLDEHFPDWIDNAAEETWHAVGGW
ncbi:MAG: hypothetical protein AB1611_08260 [bacterium]